MDRAEAARINGKKGGRPKGSTTKPQIRDFISPEESLKIINKAKQLADKGDSSMLRFLVEQIFGKARQNIGLEGGEEGAPIILAGFNLLPSDEGNNPNNKTND